MNSPSLTEKQLKIVFTNMRIFRNMLGLSQEEFGKMADIKQSEYSKIESGQKENWGKHWDDIANALGLNPFQLLIEDAQVAIKNKQFIINGMDKAEFEKNNTSFYFYQLLNAKQERQIKEDRKQLIKITRKWKSTQSKLFKSNKSNVQKEQTIKKLSEELERLKMLIKVKLNSECNRIVFNR